MKNQNSNTAKNSTKVENVENSISTNQELNSLKINAKLLDKLNNLTITEKSKNGIKSIFKKEFSEKGKRQSVRTKLFNLIDLFLLHAKRNEVEKLKDNFEKISKLCIKCYQAENDFKNIDQYCTSNLEEPKKEKLKFFLEIVKENDLK